MCGFVAVDNDENDDYDVMLMVFYPRLKAAIYPYSDAFTALSKQTVSEGISH